MPNGMSEEAQSRGHAVWEGAPCKGALYPILASGESGAVAEVPDVFDFLVLFVFFVLLIVIVVLVFKFVEVVKAVEVIKIVHLDVVVIFVVVIVIGAEDRGSRRAPEVRNCAKFNLTF